MSHRSCDIRTLIKILDRTYRQFFFRLDTLLQTVSESSAVQHSAGESVYNCHSSVLDDILHVRLKTMRGVRGGVKEGENKGNMEK